MDSNATLQTQLPALHYLAEHAGEGYHAHITIYDASGRPVGSEWITPQGAVAVKRIVAGNVAHERTLEKTRARMEKCFKKKIETSGGTPVLYNRTLTIPPTSAQ